MQHEPPFAAATPATSATQTCNYKGENGMGWGWGWGKPYHENPSESRRNIRVTTSSSSSSSLSSIVVAASSVGIVVASVAAAAAGRHCCKDLRKVYSLRHLLWLL